MSRKPKHHWFYDDLWKFNFRLVWPCDTDSLRRYIKDEFDIEWSGVMKFAKFVRVSSPDDHHTYIAALSFKWEDTTEHIAALSHECGHAALNILWDCGVDFSNADDEQLFYLQEYLLRNCLSVLRK